MLQQWNVMRGGWLGLVLLVTVAGCSGGPAENPNWPKRYRASGTVSYEGKPIEGAEIVFYSADGKSTGTGKTDSTGKFHLSTYTDKDGVVAGSHNVTIRRVDVFDPTPKDVDLSAGGKALPLKMTWIIPEKYSISGKSGLTADVTEKGPNEFKFDLK